MRRICMAKVYLRHRKGRKVEYLDHDGRWKTTGKDTKREAMTWWETERPIKQGMLFREIAEDFYTNKDEGSYLALREEADRNLSEQTVYIRNLTVKNNLIPDFGDMDVRNITPMIVQKKYATMKKRDGSAAAPGTKELYLVTLSSIMRYLVMLGAIPSNPCDSVIKVGSKVVNPKKALTDDEISRLFPEDHERLLYVWNGDLVSACFFMVMLDTGWRPGEVAGITPSCYSKEHHGLYTFRSVDSFTKNVKESIKTTKKGYDFKIGMLSRRTTDILIYLCRGKADDEVIFRTKTGKYFTSSYTNFRLPKALERAGIPLEGHPPYCFRTTFMTKLAKIAQDSVVMRLMGHTQWHTCYDKRTPLDMLDKAHKELADYYGRGEGDGDVIADEG